MLLDLSAVTHCLSFLVRYLHSIHSEIFGHSSTKEEDKVTKRSYVAWFYISRFEILAQFIILFWIFVFNRGLQFIRRKGCFGYYISFVWILKARICFQLQRHNSTEMRIFSTVTLFFPEKEDEEINGTLMPFLGWKPKNFKSSHWNLHIHNLTKGSEKIQRSDNFTNEGYVQLCEWSFWGYDSFIFYRDISETDITPGIGE